MSERLKTLLEQARNVTLSADEKELQRRSFAYGNTHLENEMITREMIDRAADDIAANVT